MYDVVLFILRGQPVHKAHEEILTRALASGKIVVAALGSSFSSRSIRNPFTFEERKRMLEAVFPSEPRLKIVPIRDYPYDDNKWVNAVRKQVARFSTPDSKIALIGHSKDESSFYLNIFRGWESIDVPNMRGINATDIRYAMFEKDADVTPIFSEVSKPVFDILTELFATEPLQKLIDEYELIKEYKDSWSAAPYPPIFHTVDAVVSQAGHVLLVKRKNAPGKGLWALPGGFMAHNERTIDGMLRELREETKLKVAEPVLLGSVKAKHVFDEPHRSTRGRTITTAFHVELSNKFDLPRVKGSDDAEKAKWVPFEQLDSSLMMEDHYHIIDYFLNIAGDY